MRRAPYQTPIKKQGDQVVAFLNQQEKANLKGRAALLNVSQTEIMVMALQILMIMPLHTLEAMLIEKGKPSRHYETTTGLALGRSKWKNRLKILQSEEESDA